MARWPLVLTLVVVAACGGDDGPAPPEIQYGLQECGFCRMIISEEKFASAVADEVGGATAFDDVGCLLDYLHEHPEAGGRVWVHDHSGGGWLAAEEASFVRDPRGSTPMGSGLVAFAARVEAEAFAAERGVGLVRWADLEGRSAPAPPP